MLLISHRGNTTGREPENENKPSYIDSALNKNFDVEVDLFVIKNRTWLGHDQPQYEIEEKWLCDRADKLWIHCKNAPALISLNIPTYIPYFNYFWHQNDAYTLTSKGYIWTFPGIVPVPKGGICLFPEQYNLEVKEDWRGICSDYISKYL